MWPFRRKRMPFLLPLNRWDGISLGQLFEGSLWIGSTGSGKSSTAQHLMLALMACDCGMLFLTAKADDYAGIERLAKLARREADLVRFAPGEQWRIDFLNHELTSPGGSIQTAGQLLQDLLDFSTRTSSQHTNEPFWQIAASRKVKMAMIVVFKAKGRCSILDLYNFCTSMPTMPGMITPTKPEDEALAQEWRQSFCCQCLLEAHQKWPDDPDLALAGDFVLKEWPRHGDGRTGASIDAHVINLLGTFAHGSVRELVASDTTNITPDDVLNGKLLVIDMPVLVGREPFQFVQMIWKLMVQRAALRRVVTPETRPAVVWADECQMHMLPSVDSMTQAVARSQKLIQVGITQNFPLMVSVLKSREDVLAWMSNLQTWFMFANGDKETNELCSSRCGHSKHLFGSISASTGPFDVVADYMGLDDQRGSFSMQEHWHPDVPPEEFVKLRKGGADNNFIVDAYVSQGGRRFSNRKTWLKCSFRQMV